MKSVLSILMKMSVKLDHQYKNLGNRTEFRNYDFPVTNKSYFGQFFVNYLGPNIFNSMHFN